MVTTDLEVLARRVALAGRDVVDVGCGDGRLARALAGRGARVTALEISDDQLAAARAAGDGADVDYAIGRAEALPLPDASQDAVVFLRSLHHVEPPQLPTALREARRVLRPRGVLYVAEPVPEGDYFALVSIVEDETGVREAAQAALADADRQGLRHRATERYEVESRLADIDAFARRMLAVNPGREALLHGHRAELERAFASRGRSTADGGKVFQQAMRADLLGAF